MGGDLEQFLSWQNLIFKEFCGHAVMNYRVLGEVIQYSCLYVKLRKRLLTGTLPVNNSLLTGTVPVNNSLLTRTVPVNKSLSTGTVPVNKSLLTGTFEVDDSL